jgi:hypothetical protein
MSWYVCGMENKRFWIGGLTTLAWIAVYCGLTFKSGVPPMHPNEWGDWCAGLAAPVAFGWLVLGYLQQGDELRQSTEALRLQAEELKQSVTQQTMLAKQASRQADLTEQSQALALRTQIVSHQPCFVRFVARNVNKQQNAISILIANAGRTCFNTRFAIVDPVAVQKFKAPPGVRNWVSGNGHEVRMVLGMPAPITVVFTITYLDEVMAPQEQRFKLGLKRLPEEEEALSVSRIGMTFNPPDVAVLELPTAD